MTSWKWTFAGWLVCLALTAIDLPAVADGQEFRVDTELFQNQEKEPLLTQLTVFSADGTIYDFCLTEPLEVTVFDPRHGRFTLLDEKRKVKASVTTQELLDYSLAIDTHAAKNGNRLVAFCAEPKFETTENDIDQNGQSLTELHLNARPLSYVARGQKPQRPEAVKAYRHFADCCARLNATRPDNLLPPGARLALNQALAERELVPLEITRTIPPPPLSLGKKVEHKTQHRWNWTLSGEDSKRIDRAGNMLATFKAVSYDEYRNPPATPSPAKQARR